MDISNFSIIVRHQLFSDNNQTAIFYCSRPGATFGFTFVNCSNITVDSLSFSCCSAAKHVVSIEKHMKRLLWRTELEINSTITFGPAGNLTHYELLPFPCLVTLMSLNCQFVMINRVTINKSKGIGFLALGNKNQHIIHTIMSYSRVNWLIIYLGVTMTNIIYSNFTNGNQSNIIGLASGLSIFTDATFKSIYEANEIQLKAHKTF